MTTPVRLCKLSLRSIICAAVSVVSCIPAVQAQTLEEVVVTAQRREQSLQEVPISVEATTGAVIQQQGFRDMPELADFSPTVVIDTATLRGRITIRGLGTAAADAVTLTNATPTFVDGVHYGRTYQIKQAFMDIERVEVLKGPQPVYFGANAVAGAFNITDRKPTPTWQGNASFDVENNNRQTFELGVGGPLTDTLGIRIAGRYDKSGGYMKDAITGDSFPHYKNYGGRVILQWTPNDKFQATAKFEQSAIHKGAEAIALCASGNGTIPPYELSVWADPPIGFGWNENHAKIPSCDHLTNIGRNSDGPYFDWPTTAMPGGTVLEDHRSIGLDIRDALNTHMEQDYGIPATGREYIEPWTSYLNMTYKLNNGIELTSLTSYSHFYRDYARDNRYAPFLTNWQYRTQDFYDMSQEVRASSHTGGRFEWMVGAYYETTDYDILVDAIRANTRHGERLNLVWEDATWKSVFANVTFNFLDNKASIDVGGRYSVVDKTDSAKGFAAQWIMPDGKSFPWGTRINFSNDPTNAALYNGASPIGLTPLVTGPITAGVATNPMVASVHNTNFSPQVTLRYRPTTNISTYFRWARSFAAGGANTGLATLPSTYDQYTFLPEHVEDFEVGVKGTFFDDRVRADVTVFTSTMTDIQLTASVATGVGVGEHGNALLDLINAGAQRTRGVEFDGAWAASDRLTLGMSGAILDAKMTNYPGADCTDLEVRTAPQSGCDTTDNTIDRSGEPAPDVPSWKFTLNANYEMPIWSNYLVTLGGMGYMSAGYITDSNGFSKIWKMNQHGDLNLQGGFGDQNHTWKITLYGKNLFEGNRPSYNAKYDVQPVYLEHPELTPSAFTTYGVKFQYFYQ